uniref:Caspase-3-like n=1 Tax=Saccoglossus kowalevskii TaxID=10224 RepID=A0ABM0GQ58_SACKO|nr:PREDICTED: caspase-3-like [Saccoglossus kowalevskii]
MADTQCYNGEGCGHTTIPNELINEYRHAKEISLKNNLIMVVDEEIIKVWDNLESLDLSKNKLSSLPKAIGELSKLKSLIIFENELKSLPDSLVRLKKLTTFHCDRIPGYIKYGVKIDNNRAEIEKLWKECFRRKPCQQTQSDSIRDINENIEKFSVVQDKTADGVRYTSRSSEDEYNMSNTRRGTAIIINNKFFDKKTGMNTRHGTDFDAVNLRRSFERLGFDVTRHDNLSARKMLQLMDLVSRESYGNCDGLVVAILSHGDDGIVYGTDYYVSIMTLVEFFYGDRCPTLAGKPKLFFIQSCFGDKAIDSAIAKSSGSDQTDLGEVKRIPVAADILLVQSTSKGSYAWENEPKGSYFIQSLCHVLDHYGDSMEVLQMMTRVSKMVVDELGPDKERLVPRVYCMLTKDLYLTPKCDS